MKKPLALSLFAMFIFSLTPLLFSTDLIELHRNDANGRPAAPYAIGKVVTVEGVVTVPSGLFSTSNFDIFIQDSTAGINVFTSRAGMPAVALGDLVRVTGAVAHYNGLTEIKDPSDVVIVAKSQPQPEPRLLTCAAVAGSFLADFSEPNESRLIRIDNVRIASANGDTYVIEDASGTCLLYHDPDAQLPALPLEGFDVIGILKQYDRTTTPPAKGGYEIIPRFSSDIISTDAPMLLLQPHETSIAPFRIELAWNTDRPSTTLFRYGKTSDYEIGAVGDSSMLIDHHVALSDLEPATLYRGRAWSSDSTGVTISSELLFMTASNRSSGVIDAYFSRSVDTTKAWEEKANGNTDLSKIIIARINQARYSLDIHYYLFPRGDEVAFGLAIAIANAKKRGVSVRFICDNETNTADNLNLSWIRDAGVPIISDRYGQNNGNAASHNKFVIIDHRDQSSGLDDYLWTGSANATENGSRSNGENMLLIQDETLCAAYTIEFNEMWGSATEVPDPTLSRFGSSKKDNTPHRFNVGGRWIEQYMSPSDNAERAIIAAIQSADYSLYFSILSFTQGSISNAMRSRYTQVPGLVIRGVFDRSSASEAYSEYSVMAGIGASSWSPPADVHLDVLSDYLHHKYLIVDAGVPSSNPVVITGSHNWSSSANTVNDENTLVIFDRRIANLYTQEFSARYHESGGGGDIVSSVRRLASAVLDPADFRLRQNYPNPFNSRTTLSMTVPAGMAGNLQEIGIYDSRGAEISRIRLKGAEEGTHDLVWDALDRQGRPLPTGIYWAKPINRAASGAIRMSLIR